MFFMHDDLFQQISQIDIWLTKKRIQPPVIEEWRAWAL